MFEVKELGGWRPGPTLLVTGGVHGDEFVPMKAIRQLAQHLCAEDVHGRLQLIPVVNEAAFARGHRTAEDDLDLARVCPGRPDGTVTERVADRLSGMIRQADFYIDLHTGGTRMAVLPLTGYNIHPDAAVLEVQRRMARAFNLPLIWGTHPGLEGRTLSVARDAGVPAIYAEYLGSGKCDPAGVTAYVEGCLNVMAALKIIDRPVIESPIEHLVEDPREKSGHMQICHPAPCSGYFDPTVKLGQRVEQGQLLGCISDPLGNHVHEVLADHAGLVLVLQTFNRVDEGVGVAVVLDPDASYY